MVNKKNVHVIVAGVAVSRQARSKRVQSDMSIHKRKRELDAANVSRNVNAVRIDNLFAHVGLDPGGRRKTWGGRSH